MYIKYHISAINSDLSYINSIIFISVLYDKVFKLLKINAFPDFNNISLIISNMYMLHTLRVNATYHIITYHSDLTT